MKSKIVIRIFSHHGSWQLGGACDGSGADGTSASILPFPALFYYYAAAGGRACAGPVRLRCAGRLAAVLTPGGTGIVPSRRQVVHLRQIGGPWYGVGIESVPTAVMHRSRCTGRQDAARTALYTPRMWYEDGGHRGHGPRSP